MGDLKRTRKRPGRRRGGTRRRLPDEPKIVEPVRIPATESMSHDTWTGDGQHL
jgi:hypothetical protein